MTAHSINWIKAFFILLALIVALLKLLAELVSETQKDVIISKVQFIKQQLDNWTPNAYFELFENKWLTGILQVCITLWLMPFVTQAILNTQEYVQSHVTEKGLLWVYLHYYSVVGWIDKYFVLQLIAAIGIAAFADGKSFKDVIEYNFQDLIGAGSIIEFIRIAIWYIFQICIICLFYWFCYWVTNLQDPVNWFLTLIRFLAALLVIFGPLCWIGHIAAMIFNLITALLVICTFYLSNFPVFILKNVFGWIYDHPKKAWGILLASFALILACEKVLTLF